MRGTPETNVPQLRCTGLAAPLHRNEWHAHRGQPSCSSVTRPERSPASHASGQRLGHGCLSTLCCLPSMIDAAPTGPTGHLASRRASGPASGHDRGRSSAVPCLAALPSMAAMSCTSKAEGCNGTPRSVILRTALLHSRLPESSKVRQGRSQPLLPPQRPGDRCGSPWSAHMVRGKHCSGLLWARMSVYMSSERPVICAALDQ